MSMCYVLLNFNIYFHHIQKYVSKYYILILFWSLTFILL